MRRINIIYGIVFFICFLPIITPAMALVIGLVFSFLNIKHNQASRFTTYALQGSIVLLGFGMNLYQVISASKTGFGITAVSVIFVITVGILIGKLLKVDSKISLLIASGTAICGGSAIAAVAPVVGAKNYQISFSLIVIFVLNAVALIIFPPIGHYFNLSQQTFGYWAAIAIHDTSSVVGAGATYGAKALEIATTVKLVRALWIIPLSIVIVIFNKESRNSKIKIPWFIGLFVLAIVFAFLVPQWDAAFNHLHWLGEKGMVIALFLIGSNISVSEAKKAGMKSFVLGVVLWLLIGISSFVILTKFLM